MSIDAGHHLFLEELTAGYFESGTIFERYLDNGRLRIRISREASSIENHIRFMDGAAIDMATRNNIGPRKPLFAADRPFHFDCQPAGAASV